MTFVPETMTRQELAAFYGRAVETYDLVRVTLPGVAERVGASHAFLLVKSPVGTKDAVMRGVSALLGELGLHGPMEAETMERVAR